MAMADRRGISRIPGLREP